MNKVLLIVLFGLFTAVSIAQTMNEMIVIKQAEFRQDQIIRQDRRDRMGRICAGLLILTDLTGLKFESNNGVVDVSYEPGRYMVFVSEGERVLDVYRDGFRPLEIILNQYGIYGLKSGQVYQLEITAKDKEVDSLPVIFNVSPADASIRVGSLSFTSGTPQSLPVGENEVVIEKEGYRPVREKIEVSSTSILFSYNLQEIEPVLVKIQSNPQNASILIDNVDRGVTNRDLWLYPGKYQVQLILTGHITRNEDLEVKEIGENTFSWNLTKNAGTLNVSTNPADAVLFINNEKYEQKQGIDLSPGLYRIEIKAVSHHSESERIEVNLGETINKSYNLKAMTGNLLLEVFPANTEVELIKNGRTVRKVSGSSRVTDLFVGDYFIKASAGGFTSIEYNVTIKENETLRKNITLEESATVSEDVVLVEERTTDIGTFGAEDYKLVSDFTLPDFNGNPVTLSDFDGLIILDFWATWCPPCRDEVPVLQRFHDEYRDKNVHIIGISTESIRIQERFRKEMKRQGVAMDYILLIDADRKVFEKYGVQGIPTTIFVTEGLRKIYKEVGFAPPYEVKFRQIIEENLPE